MKVKGIESALCSCRFQIPSALESGGFWLRKRSHLQSTTVCRKSKSRKVKHGNLLIILLVIMFTLSAAAARGPAAALEDDKESDAIEKIYREAKKAIRKGKYERASDLYRSLLEKNGQDIQALLGASFAYLKQLNYTECFNHATTALKLDVKNAHAHALAGIALLRSGLIRASVRELAEALLLNPKEALAIGGVAEIDYFEGRPRESRTRALDAHAL